MAVKKTTAQQTNTTRKTAVKKSAVKKPAAAKTAAKKSTAKKSAKTVTTDKPADYRIGELDQYLFGQGTHYEIYKKMGAHFVKDGKKTGVYFAVWAPHARSVAVVGEFNGWSEDANVMTRQEPLGIYTAFVPEAQLGQLYKYCIETQTGDKLYKADPFANSAELRPGTASRIADISHLKWSDSVWMKHRAEWDFHSSPISIYEAHIGSWMRHPGREDDGFYSYREFAHAATDYIKKMGYTHIELMGISEYPFDGSWGYQVTGYYAPTSRYGTPEDFAYMINYFHKNKIGVILDWVPAHFPRDAHGLADFDGTATFEYADPKKGEHPDWGTKIFDYGKAEVKNFLIANALFWIEHYHIDGLRVDAVASMLYLDYGKEDGQWIANKYGSNENLEAIEFFKHLNSVTTGRNPGALMIAEESTAWPKVTGKPEDDGLGFSLKWNMGWMHDFTEYMKLDPYFRKGDHYGMTFALTYAYSENYILVLSHDEVVHLKCSMLNKMPGLGFEKFANLKVGYAFMMGHPGKKLLFMGQDLAEEKEWNEMRQVEWQLEEQKENAGVQKLVKDLNVLYRENKALYECDDQAKGFQWMNEISANECYVSFVRKGEEAEELLLVVANFSGVPREITTGVPYEGKYKEILNTDAVQYGGTGVVNDRVKRAEDVEWDDKKQSVTVKMAPLSLSILQFIPYTEAELEKVIEKRIRKNTPIRKTAGKTTKRKQEK